jgi:hypothetical protein
MAPEAIVQAACNLHSQLHVKQRFKRDDERRHNLPQTPNKRTQTEAEVEDAAWCSWRGTEETKDILRVAPRRGDCDVFMNAFCPAALQSKLAPSNSNAQFLFGGSDASCATKHSTKDTHLKRASHTLHLGFGSCLQKRNLSTSARENFHQRRLVVWGECS